jgi:spore germination cell wall hydrolase CwlJ-like protein
MIDLGASFALLLSLALKFPVCAEECSRKVLKDDPKPKKKNANFFSTLEKKKHNNEHISDKVFIVQ